jgi:hypothetical protein
LIGLNGERSLDGADVQIKTLGGIASGTVNRPRWLRHILVDECFLPSAHAWGDPLPTLLLCTYFMAQSGWFLAFGGGKRSGSLPREGRIHLSGRHDLKDESVTH